MGLKKPPLLFENSHLKIMNTDIIYFKIKQKTDPAMEFFKERKKEIV
jgi:hypothetical protein